jgi:hypothetical protein
VADESPEMVSTRPWLLMARVFSLLIRDCRRPRTDSALVVCWLRSEEQEEIRRNVA